MFNYDQLIKSVFATYKDDFYNLYVNLEERNARENVNFEPWTYTYYFPKQNCSFVAECNENGNAKFCLNVKGQKYTFGGKERSVRDLMNEANVFQKVMKENHLNFCPKYSKEFENTILSANKGTIIVLNTKRMITCIGKTEKELFFKDCFSGELKDLKLESFKNGNIFSVSKDNKDSIQDLFEYAYNTRSLTANIRVSFNSKHGAYEVTNIENDLKNKEIATVKVGPILLKVINNNNHFLWYDSNNKEINRDTVEMLFGWVALSIPEIEINRPKMFLKDDLQDASFIQDVQKQIKEKRFDFIPDMAFDYSEKNDIPAFLNITGFEKQPNGSYDMVTFVFKDFRILKIGYEYKENQKPIPLPPKEIFEEDFIAFCQQKYEETISFLKTEYTPLVEKYKLEYKSQETVEDLLETVIEKHIKEKPPIICTETMNQISNEVQAIVAGYMSEQKEDSLNVSDIFDEMEL